MSARIALLLLALVAVAGCSAPTSSPADTAATTASPTSEPVAATTATPQTTTEARSTGSTGDAATVPVVGGRLGTDQGRVFRRVTAQLGVDARPPDRIRIVDPAETRTDPRPPEFLRLLGARSPPGAGFAAQTIGTDLIRVNRSVATRPRIESVLAHEYVHVVQNQRNVSGRMYLAWDEVPSGVEQRLLTLSVKEGAATYTADRYGRAHTDTLPQGTRYGRFYRQRDTAGGRYFMAPYWYGYRYVADRVAGNDTLASVYDRPPRTTEAILHRLEPGAEPPANLSVAVTAERWRPADRQRVGELGTRIALSASLNASRAAAGADGWGNDTLLPFSHGSERGYVWVLRWDDAANESEFRAAFTTALDRRATRTDAGWRDGDTAFRVRTDRNRTTTVFAGPPAFVRNASVDVGRRVRVRGP
jgi:hypothetical protein